MKAFKVIYKHGHFIDVETKLRIIPVQDSLYTITANDNDFRTEDTTLHFGLPMEKDDKRNWMTKKYKAGNFEKILPSGTQLFFRVGNSKKIEGDEDHQYIFVCTILEDLYLYLLNKKNGEEEEHWRLADCKCILDKCVLGGMTLTDKIPAHSLNNLFTNTVQFYFRLQRTPTANVFDTFFLYEEGMHIGFESAINKRYFGINEIRKKIANYKRNSK